MTTEHNKVFSEIRWFEDFAQGQTYHYGAWTMEREAMLAYARLYDPEPFHIDEQAAVDQGWGALIASGPQVLSIWRRMSKDAFPSSETVISPGWDKVRWTRPVYADDVLCCDTLISEVRELSSRPAEGLVVLDNAMKNQKGETVCTLVSNWFVRRRPG